MYVWQFILFLIFWVFIDYFMVRFEIKSNIDLFYALYRKEVLKELKKNGKI